LNKYILVAILIGAILCGYYYVTSHDSLTPDISCVNGPSSSSLTDIQGNETKIFLVSTDNPRYGVYNWRYTGYGAEINEGDPCFIVSVTVRNDYTTNSIFIDEDSPFGLINNHVKLTANLYNQQGRVDAVDVTYPINSLHGGHVFVVDPG